jgi:hypothetical protein
MSVRTCKAVTLASVMLAIALRAAEEQCFAFVAADRWTATASGTTDFRGQPATLTWSLVPDGTPIPDRDGSRLIARLDAALGAGAGGDDLRQRPWFSLIESSFSRWSALGGVRFVYEPLDDGAPHQTAAGQLGVRGDVRLAAAPGDGPGGVLAASQFPNTGDVVLDADDGSMLANFTGDYLRLRNSLMHEIGHVLGLDHIASSDAKFLMEPQLSLDFDGPQIDDIRGLHHLYGDRFERLNGGLGNGDPALAAPLGLVRVGDEAALGVDAIGAGPIVPNAADFLSISGLGDVDCFAFDVESPGRLDVQLTPRGGRFRQGLPGEAESLIDADASSDLALALLDASGAELAAANAHPRGFGESLDGLLLPGAGEFVIRISGSRDVIQLYDLRIRLLGVATPEPTAISLVAPWLPHAARRRKRRALAL